MTGMGRRVAKLEWNLGAWCGAQVGGTVWMAVAAVLTSVDAPTVGLTALALAALPNVVGVLLWRRRAAWSCYRATQLLLSVIGVAGLGVVFLLDRHARLQQIRAGGTIEAGWAYAAVAGTVVLLLLFFRLRFGAAERR